MAVDAGGRGRHVTSQEAYEIAFMADFIRGLPDSQFANLAWADLDNLERGGDGPAKPPAR